MIDFGVRCYAYCATALLPAVAAGFVSASEFYSSPRLYNKQNFGSLQSWMSYLLFRSSSATLLLFLSLLDGVPYAYGLFIYVVCF